MVPPVPAEFRLVTSKGANCAILVDNLGFTYSRAQSNCYGQMTSWRCSKKKRLKCKATLYTQDNWICQKRNEHNHLVND